MLPFLLACAEPAPTEADPTERPPARVEDTFIARTDADGLLEVEVAVGDEDDAFMVVGERAGGYLQTVQLADPDGALRLFADDWTGGDERLTHAVFLTSAATTLNWPPREADGPLTPGTWTATLAAYTANDALAPDKELEITVIRRRAADTAVLPVLIAYADGLEEEPALVEATEAAVGAWEDIYLTQGVALDVTWGTVAVDGALPYAHEGDDAYADLFAAADPRGVVVVIGDVIGESTYYGECPSNPGPFAPTSISAVEVSWLALAGEDGVFGEEEVALFGITLAHEVGHYLGLFHAVQLVDARGAPATAWDALEDTPRCENYATCTEELGSNLMFPFPVCTRPGCMGGTELTDDQGAVLRGYVGVGAAR